MNRLSAFTHPPAEQANCALFTVLPGEIRDHIFEYVLRSYDDADNMYDRDTPYCRPGYLAPSKADRALLQTCQRVYGDAWYWPWATAVHTFWLGRSTDSTVASYP